MDTVSNKQIITSFHLCHMLLQRNTKYSKGWGEMTKGQSGKGRNRKGRNGHTQWKGAKWEGAKWEGAKWA
jgi:hypothetical protein